MLELLAVKKRIPQAKRLNQQKFLCHSSEDLKCKMKASAGLVPSDGREGESVRVPELASGSLLATSDILWLVEASLLSAFIFTWRFLCMHICI